MREEIRIFKKHYRDEETGKVKGIYHVQKKTGKNWKTIKQFPFAEPAQAFCRKLLNPLPKDRIIKLWK